MRRWNIKALAVVLVVLALFLIIFPQFLPTSTLDGQTESEINSLLLDIYRQKGITMILVTHDGSLVQRGTRSIVMNSGQVVSDVNHVDSSRKAEVVSLS